MPRKRVQIFPIFEELRRVTAVLTDAQFGKAMRHALSRYYDRTEPADGDSLVSMAATMMLEQAARYDSFREQQRENRAKSKIDTTPNETEVHQVQPTATEEDPVEPRISPSPVPVPIPVPNDTCVKALKLLNTLSGSSFRATTKATQKLIAAREKDGYTLEDLEMVIRHQCALWGKDANMVKYLRPETLFGTKFEGYLSDARRSGPDKEQGYVLASVEDPWEVAMRGADGCV